MNNIIEINNLEKSYNKKKIKVIDKVNYKFKNGKIYSLIGPSGSGKSTLLNLLSLIDIPNSGTIFSYYIENVRQFISDIFNISLFPEEIYFLSKMPSEINVQSITIIAICSLIVTSIVSIYPAIKASKQDPVKALKYE